MPRTPVLILFEERWHFAMLLELAATVHGSRTSESRVVVQFELNENINREEPFLYTLKCRGFDLACEGGILQFRHI